MSWTASRLLGILALLLVILSFWISAPLLALAVACLAIAHIIEGM